MKYQAQSIRHRIFSYVAGIVIPLIGFVNCSSPPAPTLPPRLPNAEELLKTRSSNTLGPGDVIEVRVYREPDLSGLYHVSPAGTFNFPLIGEVKANRGGIYELTSEITRRLKQEYLRDPQVTVLIKETRSKKVFVLGMVKKPGSFVFDSQMTVVQAIALAGGLQALASRSIVLIRENDDGADQKIRPVRWSNLNSWRDGDRKGIGSS